MSGTPAEEELDAPISSVAGDVIVVAAAGPAPIGTRVRVPMARAGLAAPGAEPLRGKVIDVRRAGAGFAITIRLHSVTRAQRAALAAVAGAAQAGA